MTSRKKDIEARNRETEALAERWELRIHAIAWCLTAIVLAMRLVAGRDDLTSDGYWDDSAESLPPGEALGYVPSHVGALPAEPAVAGSLSRSEAEVFRPQP